MQCGLRHGLQLLPVTARAPHQHGRPLFRVEGFAHIHQAIRLKPAPLGHNAVVELRLDVPPPDSCTSKLLVPLAVTYSPFESPFGVRNT